MRTVLPASGIAGAHDETLPAASIARNCTDVSPSAVIGAGLPASAAAQVTPPSDDARYSEPTRPAPPGAVGPGAPTATCAPACRPRAPPLTDGATGALRSMRAVPPGFGTSGAQEEVLPA